VQPVPGTGCILLLLPCRIARHHRPSPHAVTVSLQVALTNSHNNELEHALVPLAVPDRPRRPWDQVVHQLYAPGGGAVGKVAAQFPSAVVDEGDTSSLLQSVAVRLMDLAPRLRAIAHHPHVPCSHRRARVAAAVDRRELAKCVLGNEVRRDGPGPPLGTVAHASSTHTQIHSRKLSAEGGIASSRKL
jgi:hypothetical protein